MASWTLGQSPAAQAFSNASWNNCNAKDQNYLFHPSHYSLRKHENKCIIVISYSPFLHSQAHQLWQHVQHSLPNHRHFHQPWSNIVNHNTSVTLIVTVFLSKQIIVLCCCNENAISYSHLVCDVCTCSPPEQKLDHQDMSIPGSYVQWCVPMLYRLDQCMQLMQHSYTLQ